MAQSYRKQRLRPYMDSTACQGGPWNPYDDPSKPEPFHSSGPAVIVQSRFHRCTAAANPSVYFGGSPTWILVPGILPVSYLCLSVILSFLLRFIPVCQKLRHSAGGCSEMKNRYSPSNGEAFVMKAIIK